MGDSGEAQPTAIGTDEDPTRGRPYHDKVTQDLKTMLAKRRILERNCSMMDEAIYKKETEYLEDTPYGNILIGFDNYIKGSSSSAPGGGRRKAGVDDSNRVFSRSSIRYNDVTDSPGFSSSHTTPAAPTPINTSFLKGDASNNATPTSATSANKTGAGLKKTTKKATGEDSETDTKDGKKNRITLASRK